MGLELPFLSGCSVLTTASMGGREPKLRSQRGYTYRVAVGGTSAQGKTMRRYLWSATHQPWSFRQIPANRI